MKLGSLASTAGSAAAKGTAWTGGVGAGGKVVLVLELGEKVVLALEGQVEQMVKEAPPFSFW